MDFPDIPALETFDERMAYYADVRVERDLRTWILGYGAFTECQDKPAGGRPLPTDFTIAKFAAMLGEKVGPIGEYRNNYAFWLWGGAFELIPDNASWRQCADARRASGWRPGMEVTGEHIQHAVEILIQKVDNAEPRPLDTRPLWAREIERASTLLTRAASRPDMPPLVRLAVK